MSEPIPDPPPPAATPIPARVPQPKAPLPRGSRRLIALMALVAGGLSLALALLRIAS